MKLFLVQPTLDCLVIVLPDYSQIIEEGIHLVVDQVGKLVDVAGRLHAVPNRENMTIHLALGSLLADLEVIVDKDVAGVAQFCNIFCHLVVGLEPETLNDVIVLTTRLGLHGGGGEDSPLVDLFIGRVLYHLQPYLGCVLQSNFPCLRQELIQYS